jgi:hypothetical protein
MPKSIADSMDDALEGFVRAELVISGTIFCIGFGLFSLSWFSNYTNIVKIPLYVGGMGAMLFGYRLLYAHYYQ